MDIGKDQAIRRQNRERCISPRKPWTHEQINEFLPKLEEKIAEEEAENPNIRPLPPMTVAECQEFFFRFNDIANTRALTNDECFMQGQLLAVFQYAVRAETLGHKGRFFVLSEEEINRLVKVQ